ncbi:LysR family transcriptional regulator [Brevibacterium oceani]|uniref:LysR family transcriptional regulator n=1 Tax=Brevibacterium oceani TaxID=358099 RepID=UPI001B321E2F|nr:LysR family transcriptional regulator [Brevibacterium oceani]
MDAKQIRAFLVLAEELHFGRAAERLQMTQPPVSRLIRNLETSLSAQLFDRSTRSVRLTAAGEALVQPARDILMSHQLAEAAVKAAGQGEVGHVRLAFTGIATHTLVGRLAKLVRNTHPGIQLSLQSATFALPSIEGVVDGSFDIAFGHWPFIPQTVETRMIAEEALVVAVHNGHPLAGRSSVSMAELEGEDFITLPSNPGSTTIERLYSLSQAAGFNPNVVQVAPDSWTILSLVGAEFGCSVTVSSVPRNFTFPNVTFIPLDDEQGPFPLLMAWRRHDDSPALREVLRLAEQLFPHPGQTE